MDFAPIIKTVIYTILALFCVITLYTLCVIANWIKVKDPKERKVLIRVFVAQIGGCVLGFAWAALDQMKNQHVVVLTKEMLCKGHWGWQYSPKNWMTEASFDQVGDKMQFSAHTYYRRTAILPGKEKEPSQLINDNYEIFVYKSEPFDLPEKPGDDIVFKCKQTILADVLRTGPDAPTPGQYDVIIRLQPSALMEGYYSVDDDRTRGGIYLTHDVKN